LIKQDDQPIIAFQHIIKIFPPDIVALNDVSIEFFPGEIHAIIGENGAGKSTLMKILYAVESKDGGRIFYRGESVNFSSPKDAIAKGIGMVHQEILLVPEYTIWQNIVLGLEPVKRLGNIDEKKAIVDVQKKIDEFGFRLDPRELVKNISIAAQQKVEILKLLYRNVSVLILDEPTSVLTPQEVPQLFKELKRLRDKGHTILFVSHRLDEVLALSDRISVLRKGKLIGTVPAQNATKNELARMMVGREIFFTPLKRSPQHGEVVFKANNLIYRDETKIERLRNVSFHVAAGEIVGIAGVEGNGQLELVNAIMGLIKPQEGSIFIQNHEVLNKSILERRKLISFVPQDRKRMGSAAAAPVSENLIMTHHKLDEHFQKWHGVVLDFQEVKHFTEEVRNRFSIDMSSEQIPFQTLSGGNQQKAILGRELTLKSKFVLLDQPTRGLDVGSIEYVHEQITAMREEGRAILLFSSDLDELFRITDRILVLYRGAIVANLEAENTTIDEVGYLMLEGKKREK